MIDLDILLDTIHDTYMIIPILFIVYLVLEYFEHIHITQSIERSLSQYGPILGAILGMIPQCGFGVLASTLFIDKKITIGTLISVFIATSDEAIPILLTNPKQYSTLLIMIFIKFILAIIVGYIVDIFLKTPDLSYHSAIDECDCHHGVVKEAMLRTLKIFAFIFVVNYVLTLGIDMIGEETLSYILLQNSLLQPLVSALFGFIPNCAASVIMTQLYINNALSFASLLAGLVTNAGLGILVLLQHRINAKALFQICFILFISAICISIPLQWFFLH